MVQHCNEGEAPCHSPVGYHFLIFPLSLQKLESEGTLNAISDAIRSGSTEYSVSELSIPGLRHFVYKSRQHVQITVPTFEEPYDNLHEKRR